MLKKQIVNFILVGILNTIFGYFLYVLFIYLGFNYVVSLFFATIIGVLFNFKTISKYVFDSSDKKLILKFSSVYLIVFVVNVILVKFFKLLGMNEYLSGFFAIVPISILSFILNKFFVYKK